MVLWSSRGKMIVFVQHILVLKGHEILSSNTDTIMFYMLGDIKLARNWTFDKKRDGS